MYISNITHFLDETGNVPKQMPKEARELASFLTLVIDTTTKSPSPKLTPTEIRCFEKGCHGLVWVGIEPSNEIHWKCSHCENEGLISEWQGTKWDNR
jgi:hypothetical protein